MACATYQLLIARVDYFILYEMISLGKDWTTEQWNLSEPKFLSFLLT